MIRKREIENAGEDFIPGFKVQIHRKISTENKISKEEIFKELFSNFRYKKSIPRVELMYHSPEQGASNKREMSEPRPVASPMSVILKSDQSDAENKKISKPRLKVLPVLKKNQNINSEISVSGNSISYCDWVGVLLYNRSISRCSKSNHKFMKGQKTADMNQDLKKIRNRVFKGRSLLKKNY